MRPVSGLHATFLGARRVMVELYERRRARARRRPPMTCC
eukprot:COSAG01_NODE_24250_length_785_cov_1.325073_1_plen_38_part_10